jgi:hypothetical protein
MRTSELFRFCLGREFKVYGFDGYGFVELRPSDDPDVKREFGNHQTIWIDPEQVEALGAVSTQSLSPARVIVAEANFRRILCDARTAGGLFRTGARYNILSKN